MESIRLIDPLKYELDDNTEFEIQKIAQDEFFEEVHKVFFYGKIIDEDAENVNIDELKWHARCPDCGSVITFESKPKDNEDIVCSHCKSEGFLLNFNDKATQVDDLFVSKIAMLEMVPTGHVLRLFDVSLSYDNRDYDDYKTLDCNPELWIIEAGREYWCEGKVYFYQNNQETPYDEEEWVRFNTITDGDYWIVNYNNDYDPMIDSNMVDDILSEASTEANTFIDYIAERLSYKAFMTLKKYGFERLLYETIYVPGMYQDSIKIFEVLGVDYNQVKSSFDLTNFDSADLKAARELAARDISLTKPNIEVMTLVSGETLRLLHGKERKLFKYLRNQVTKLKNKNVVKDYNDYIRDCNKLGYDLNDKEVIFPSDLQAFHAKTAKLVKIEESVSVDQQIAAIYGRYHHLCEWSDNNFTIIMPKSSEEVIEEGIRQHHCVGNYCERIASGESLILFIRRNEDLEKSFYTLEIKPIMKNLSVAQCRGYDNKDESEEMKEEIQDFLVQYSDWFQRRKITEAVAEERITRIYYKAVKKTDDGRHISAWDGKTEYKVGEVVTTRLSDDPDHVAVSGIHLASLAFAQKYGNLWSDVAILEIEVDIKDVIVPDAKDQIRTSRGKVLREVPMSEMGEWGEKHANDKKEKIA